MTEWKRRIYILCTKCGKLNLYTSRLKGNSERVIRELQEIENMVKGIIEEVERHKSSETK